MTKISAMRDPCPRCGRGGARMAGDKHDPLRAVRYRTIVADPQQMTVDDCVAVATHDLDKTIDTVQLTIL